MGLSLHLIYAVSILLNYNVAAACWQQIHTTGSSFVCTTKYFCSQFFYIVKCIVVEDFNKILRHLTFSSLFFEQRTRKQKGELFFMSAAVVSCVLLTESRLTPPLPFSTKAYNPPPPPPPPVRNVSDQRVCCRVCRHVSTLPLDCCWEVADKPNWRKQFIVRLSALRSSSTTSRLTRSWSEQETLFHFGSKRIKGGTPAAEIRGQSLDFLLAVGRLISPSWDRRISKHIRTIRIKDFIWFFFLNINTGFYSLTVWNPVCLCTIQGVLWFF